MKKRLVYFGTPELAANVLEKLAGSPVFEIAAVVTNPDAPAGRAQKLQPSAVKQMAEKLQIPVFTPKTFDKKFLQELQNINADFSLIVVYGKILPREIIDLPPLGTFNLHPSLLPKYRGSSPVQSALLNGDKISGFTIFRLIKKMDAGPVYVQEKVELNEKNAAEVFAEMEERGGDALLRFAEALVQGEKFEAKPQDENQVTYSRKFTKADGEIFPAEENAEEILRKYRAFYIWPQIYWIDPASGKRVKFLELQRWGNAFGSLLSHKLFNKIDGKCVLKTAHGFVEIIRAQPEGKEAMSGMEFWNWWMQQIPAS